MSAPAPAIDRLAVIGAGAWGTALAATALRGGRQVTLWAREPDLVDSLMREQRNPVYLPDHPLPAGLAATTDPAVAVAGAQAVLLVTPAQHVREAVERLRPHWPQGAPAVICAKGLELGTGALLSDAVAAVLPGVPLAVLSGPTFAAEVADGRPSAITLACADPDLGETLVAALGTQTFRPYYSADVIGAQVGGAVKNVMAIAAGIGAGFGLGDNARAALLTRGLAEVTRLGEALGGWPATLHGLSGLGDLVLTCTGEQSRNMSLGLALGQGRALADILGERKAVTEGVHTAAAVIDLARRKGVEMPICEAVHTVLNGDATIREMVGALLSRPFRTETT